MGLKDDTTKALENAKDRLSEGGHDAVANAEQAKRDLVGDELTPDEVAGSKLNQAKNEIQAGVDRAKREIRGGA
jgi:F0F1-type ATP synthase membrane subunit b/b'